MKITKTIKNLCENSFIDSVATGILTYGMAYAGRSYLAINPLHVALFSFATCLTHHIASKLALGKNTSHQKLKIDNDKIPLLHRRMAVLFYSSVPAMYVIGKSVFSPLQTVVGIGLMALSERIKSTITG